MKADEFVRNCASLGYCGQADARAYTAANPKPEYGIDDYIAAFRKNELQIEFERAAQREVNQKWRSICGGTKTTNAYSW